MKAFPAHSYRREHDLNKAPIRKSLLSKAQGGDFFWAHLGTPCMIWSHLRFISAGTCRTHLIHGDGSREDECIADRELSFSIRSMNLFHEGHQIITNGQASSIINHHQCHHHHHHQPPTTINHQSSSIIITIIKYLASLAHRDSPTYRDTLAHRLGVSSGRYLVPPHNAYQTIKPSEHFQLLIKWNSGQCGIVRDRSCPKILFPN